MFIVKDRRKIGEILFDPQDSRELLKLSKRKHELQGCVDILCSDMAVGQLSNLKMLNLYENEIESLQNIGKLAPPSTSLTDLNLGNNLIKDIPDEFATLKSLKKLWIDDNYLEEFPITLCCLTALTELRLSGNQMTMIPPSIDNLQLLTTLSLDNNRIEQFPMGILKLPVLEHLWLRQNKITVLPDEISTLTMLKTLSVSTNKLLTLPTTITALVALEYLYANANMIDDSQHAILNALCTLPNIKKMNFANNKLAKVPSVWESSYGKYSNKKGVLSMTNDNGGDEGDENDDHNKMERDDNDDTVIVTLIGNPLEANNAGTAR